MMSITEERPSIVTHDIHAHPGPRRYVQIAAILAVLTAMEVELSYLHKQWHYVEQRTWVVIPPLIILAIVKFTLVAAFFMHLRFDNRIFTVFFAGGIAVALTVFIAILSIQRVFFA
jgi:cytochrome c oxidase subunit 4